MPKSCVDAQEGTLIPPCLSSLPRTYPLTWSLILSYTYVRTSPTLEPPESWIPIDWDDSSSDTSSTKKGSEYLSKVSLLHIHICVNDRHIDPHFRLHLLLKYALTDTERGTLWGEEETKGEMDESINRSTIVSTASRD